MRRGPARAENFLMTGGPPVKRLLIFFGSAGRRFFGSPGAELRRLRHVHVLLGLVLRWETDTPSMQQSELS